jgi:hypothetical protein
MTRRGGVMMSARRVAAPGRKNGEDGASWADANLTVLKNEENTCGRFNSYKWTVKI